MRPLNSHVLKEITEFLTGSHCSDSINKARCRLQRNISFFMRFHGFTSGFHVSLFLPEGNGDQ